MGQTLLEREDCWRKRWILGWSCTGVAHRFSRSESRQGFWHLQGLLGSVERKNVAVGGICWGRDARLAVAGGIPVGR